MKILALLGQVSWKRLIIAVLLSLTSGASATLIIKSIHTTLKEGIPDLQEFIILFAVLLALFGIAAVISTRMLSRLTQKVLYDLRVNISRKVLEANFEKIEYRGSSIYTILTEDINTILRTVNKLPGLFTSLTTALGCFIYLFVLSWQLSLMVISVFLAVFILIQLNNSKLRFFAGKSRTSMVAIFERFEGLIYGLKELTLDSNHRKKFIEIELPEACETHMNFKYSEQVNIQVTSKISEVLLLSGIAIILIIVSLVDFVSLTTFSEFLTITLFIVTPLAAASEFMKLLKPVEIALDQIEAVGIELEKLANKNEQKHELNRNEVKTVVQLKNAEYEYYNQEDDSYFKLGPIDLDIRKGELIFVVGGNGSGKTTLAKILTGLYVPKGGHIIYEGSKINLENLRSYRNQFTAIFTDSYLFDKIDYLNKVDPVKVEEYLKLLELDHKIKFENNTYSSTKLSSGQRKRLGLLTALLEDKDLYLFDEWAANQDPHFKKVFYRQIIKALIQEGKTVILISHDENYFDLADRIIQLEEGKIKEVMAHSISFS